MRKLSYLDAINEALDESLAMDDSVYLIGEDIGVYGGGFKATSGLIDKYGEKRVRCTPISESVIAGVCVGSAMTGMRPVMELQFSDFITCAMDQLVNQAAKIHYMYAGKASVPMVMRTAAGSGTGAGAQHSQNLENWMAHVPGLIVIQPSCAYDAKGLLHSAIKNNNPVMFYEHKLCYKLEDNVPEGPYELPIGVADIKREGTDITVVATGYMVHHALEAAKKLERLGISLEVIDPRTLVPFDAATVCNSVSKTHRLMIVTESVKRSGFGGEIAATVAESDAFYDLVSPIERLGGEFVPMPADKLLESMAVPQQESIERSALRLMNQGAISGTIQKKAVVF